MGLGVLDDPKLQHVPGTSYVLDNDPNSSNESVPNSKLKYDRSGPVPIILVPQPSDDPNDPLNWPLWKRDIILAVLSFIAVLCATTSPLMAANTVTVSLYYQKNFTSVALLTGYHLLGVGIAGLLFVPTARVWGKRHLFLFGNVLMIVSSAWGGSSGHNYTSLVWARVFQGVALAPFEALVNASVGDLYFLHERGTRMALSNVALFGGSFLTPVFVGKITHSLNWQWTFYFIAIFAAAALPLTFFLVPETAFRRANYLNTDFVGDIDRQHLPRELRLEESDLLQSTSPDTRSSSGENGGSSAVPKTSSTTADNEKESNRDIERSASAVSPTQKVPYLDTLKLFNGRKTDESFFKLFFRPFPLFLTPGILWACLIQGVLIGWTVFLGVVLAAVFLGPPLWFNEVKTGYLYTGPFIGSIVGLVLSGLLANWTSRLMIKWNNGKYEPEFRIVLVFFQLIFGGIGLYGFGMTAEHVDRYGWLIPDVFFMFVIIGMVMGAVSSALYVVDAHRQVAVEAFTCLLVFKNIFSFILTYFAYDWIIAGGVQNVFIIISSIQVGVCLLSIPMYIFGKRNRAFLARHDILKILHLW